MSTLRPQSNGSLYSNTVIGTLAVDGWAVYIWYIEEGLEQAAAPPSPLLAVPNVTAHPLTSSVPKLHIIRCGTIIASAFYKVNSIVMKLWSIDRRPLRGHQFLSSQRS